MDASSSAARRLGRVQRLRHGVLAALIGVIAVVFVFGRSALGEMAHEQLELLGTLLIVTGIGGRLWSTLYIGGRKSATVVDSGPYSITRNPLYLFSSVAAAGVGAQIGSIVAAALFGLLCALAFHVLILREEEHLSHQLGAPYDAYRARVPRFVPRPSLYRDLPQVTFEPRLLMRTFRDGLVFLLALPLFEVVERAQSAGYIPVLFSLW